MRSAYHAIHESSREIMQEEVQRFWNLFGGWKFQPKCWNFVGELVIGVYMLWKGSDLVGSTMIKAVHVVLVA